jgi:hypothetical protein
VTRKLPVPGLTRDLRQPHEAPDQVRGGFGQTAKSQVNTTLTPTLNPLAMLNNPDLSTVDTP